MRRAFTLVELLIAMALTIILVYAIVQFYAYVGETVRDGRAQIEMGGNLRQAASRLQQDFAELTVRVGGRIDTGSGEGCLEIVEGIDSDSDPDGDQLVDTTTYASTNTIIVNNRAVGPMQGDIDDVLVFTIRSQGDPFVGRRFTGLDANGVPQYRIEQSNLAEVVWFTTFKDTNGNGVWNFDSNGNGILDAGDSPEPRYLVRRQLLIRPDLLVGAPNNGTNPFLHNDISCRVGLDAMGNPVFVANSLGDLSRRENRMIHQNLVNLQSNGLIAANNWLPNPLQMNLLSWNSCAMYSLDGINQFAGEDRMLSNLLAFDVRVYDPYAVLVADGDTTGNTPTTADDAHGVLSPGDPGYAAAVLNYPAMGTGAFVDLWYARMFANIPQAQRTTILQNCNSAYAFAPNLMSYPNGVAAWDSWTTAYEKDGLDQFGDMRIDLMVDGLDNDNLNGVDDPGEAETQPPYPVWIGSNGVDDDGQNGPDDPGEKTNYLNPDGSRRPAPSTLRGIEVRIRVYEPGTRQTRQVTVATDFIPE